MIAVLVLGFATLAIAKPVYLVNSAKISANPVTVGDKQFVRYTITYTDAKDMWQSDSVNFCADALREGCNENLPLAFVKSEGLTRTWDTPMDVIQGGQSGVNFAKDEDWFNTLWLGLPDRKLEVGSNLVCARSVVDPEIPHSGGVYLLYTGPGAPYVPSATETGNDGRPVIFPCGGGQASAVRNVAVTPATVKVVPVSAKAGMVQSVVNSPDSQNVQTKQVAKVKVYVKGNQNRTTTVTTQKKAVITQKGSTVKGSYNKVCTYNISVVNFGSGNSLPNDCTGCHNEQVWNKIKDNCFGNCTTQTVTVKKEVTNKK